MSPVLAHPVERVTHRFGILRQGRLALVDSLRNLRKVIVRRLEIELGEPVDADELCALARVREVQVNGRIATVGFAGSTDAVVKAAAAHQVPAIRPLEDDLGDIFLRYYRKVRRELRQRRGSAVGTGG